MMKPRLPTNQATHLFEFATKWVIIGVSDANKCGISNSGVQFL
jgi:hypothetical protein